ncbi:hypothetical protein RDJLphi1_gp38 [Roseobacter phage RDJL Phi 1]|uniref:DUF6456 domain-containing protein n=1 Tax=Roseobacter phage RDJL Phi 1 TaxID=562742 RepID=F4YXP9_9CAUD|nr:hypothetical protein RDJLphi1_gp38 [Roseobacter phage RDJL Phi 1]ADK73439.1 hypothetical protein RDJLphi1_gp38 [Roseobacter phage RDJL Phi 1]
MTQLLRPQSIEAYIRHTVDGKTMRDIARTEDVEPSTILRQIRRIEDLRSSPEWDCIVEALENHWDREGSLTRYHVFKAFDLDLQTVTKEMQLCMPLLVQDGALVGITNGKQAGIFIEHEVMRRVDRNIALSWVALGWLILDTDSSRVRRYRITDRASTELPVEPDTVPNLGPTKRSKDPGSSKLRYTNHTWNNEPIDRLYQLSRRKSVNITNEDIDTAQRIRNLMLQAVVDGKGSEALKLVINMEKSLGPDMFNLLYAFLYEGRGLEKIEQSFAWSARSAKIVLMVALQQVRHFGLLETEQQEVASIAAE